MKRTISELRAVLADKIRRWVKRLEAGLVSWVQPRINKMAPADRRYVFVALVAIAAGYFSWLIINGFTATVVQERSERPAVVSPVLPAIPHVPNKHPLHGLDSLLASEPDQVDSLIKARPSLADSLRQLRALLR